MPNETKNYVPKLLAYKRIIDEPERYGFTLPKVDNHPYFVSLPVTQDIDVDKVIELSEITREQFLALNPSFNGPVILQGFNQEILLPYGKSEIFKKNLKKHQSSLSSWTVVKVDKTDTVDNVAERLQTDPDVLREMNKIPKGMKIRSGSTLLIPKAHNSQENVPLELAQNPSLSLEKEFIPVPVVMRCKGKKCIAVPTNLANYSSKEYTNTRNVSRTSQETNHSKKVTTSKTSKKPVAKNSTAKQSSTTSTKSSSSSSTSKPAAVSQKSTVKSNTSKKQTSNY
jgi:membrane-bound lytic murein transglycosylase D